jgi:tetratricopeptide (TPR) repeat protein
MKKKLLIFFLCNFIFIGYSFAHGDLHERIVEVTKEIKVAPDSIYLYLKRGKLYYQHESYQKSINDLNTSKNLGYNSVEQKLLFAKAYFKLEDYKTSLSYSDNILFVDPENVHAHKIKAQTLLKLGKFYDSAESFEAVINYATQSFPQNYIDASMAWELLQNDEGNVRANSIIEKGIENLGDLISLYNRLIDLSIKQENYDFAIAKQYRVISLSPRKETAYYKLSELYLLNENPKKALENLNLAKEHYNNLPVRLQSTSFMKELIDNIKSKEAQLQKI